MSTSTQDLFSEIHDRMENLTETYLHMPGRYPVIGKKYWPMKALFSVRKLWKLIYLIPIYF